MINIREFLKNDQVTKGMKISESAINHIEFLIKKFFDPKIYMSDKMQIAIEFYALGYVTGRLEK